MLFSVWLNLRSRRFWVNKPNEEKNLRKNEKGLDKKDKIVYNLKR